MHLCLRLRPCRAGDCLPLLPAELPGVDVWPAHCLAEPIPRPLPRLPVGSRLYDADGTELLKVTGRIWLPSPSGLNNPHAHDCPLVTALTDIAPIPIPDNDALCLEVRKEGRSLAWITLSDKGSQGLREDLSGPVIKDMAAARLPL